MDSLKSLTEERDSAVKRLEVLEGKSKAVMSRDRDQPSRDRASLNRTSSSPSADPAVTSQTGPPTPDSDNYNSSDLPPARLSQSDTVDQPSRRSIGPSALGLTTGGSSSSRQSHSTSVPSGSSSQTSSYRPRTSSSRPPMPTPPTTAVPINLAPAPTSTRPRSSEPMRGVSVRVHDSNTSSHIPSDDDSRPSTSTAAASRKSLPQPERPSGLDTSLGPSTQPKTGGDQLLAGAAVKRRPAKPRQFSPTRQPTPGTTLSGMSIILVRL